MSTTFCSFVDTDQISSEVPIHIKSNNPMFQHLNESLWMWGSGRVGDFSILNMGMEYGKLGFNSYITKKKTLDSCCQFVKVKSF